MVLFFFMSVSHDGRFSFVMKTFREIFVLRLEHTVISEFLQKTKIKKKRVLLKTEKSPITKSIAPNRKKERNVIT